MRNHAPRAALATRRAACAALALAAAAPLLAVPGAVQAQHAQPPQPPQPHGPPPTAAELGALPYEISPGERLRIAGLRDTAIVLRDVQPADLRNPTWVTVIVTPGPVPPAQRQRMGRDALATTGIYRLTAPVADGQPRTVHGRPALLFEADGVWNNTGAPARLVGLAVFDPRRVFFVFVGGTLSEMQALGGEVTAILESFRPRAT